MDLRKLSDPFPAGDIEWRVSRSGTNARGVFCLVLAYITARAIAKRLDDVCGPENWCNTPQEIKEVRVGVCSVQVGISIRVDGEWITKYDVSEPTNIEPAKGGFSGAMKRAGAQWGIGRYLYHLSETFAEVSEKGGKGWEYAKLPEKSGGGIYYWKPPQLPGWALPPELESEKAVTQPQVTALKKAWQQRFAADITNKVDLASGFERFVHSVVGEFPTGDLSCWTSQILSDCHGRIKSTTDGTGPSGDVPFE